LVLSAIIQNTTNQKEKTSWQAGKLHTSKQAAKKKKKKKKKSSTGQ
jgi:hypothetical protein